MNGEPVFSRRLLIGWVAGAVVIFAVSLYLMDSDGTALKRLRGQAPPETPLWRAESRRADVAEPVARPSS